MNMNKIFSLLAILFLILSLITFRKNPMFLLYSAIALSLMAILYNQTYPSNTTA